MKNERYPTCGHPVDNVFEHVDILCEHDMTPEEIGALLTVTDWDPDTATHTEAYYAGVQAGRAAPKGPVLRVIEPPEHFDDVQRGEFISGYVHGQRA